MQEFPFISQFLLVKYITPATGPWREAILDGSAFTKLDIPSKFDWFIPYIQSSHFLYIDWKLAERYCQTAVALAEDESHVKFILGNFLLSSYSHSKFPADFADRLFSLLVDRKAFQKEDGLYFKELALHFALENDQRIVALLSVAFKLIKLDSADEDGILEFSKLFYELHFTTGNDCAATLSLLVGFHKHLDILTYILWISKICKVDDANWDAVDLVQLESLLNPKYMLDQHSIVEIQSIVWSRSVVKAVVVASKLCMKTGPDCRITEYVLLWALLYSGHIYGMSEFFPLSLLLDQNVTIPQSNGDFKLHEFFIICARQGLLQKLKHIDLQHVLMVLLELNPHVIDWIGLTKEEHEQLLKTLQPA